MHVLIIPSEEYIPVNNPIAGIFQHDQARIIQANGHTVGALSFSFKHSFSTLIRSFFGKRNRHTRHLSAFAVLRVFLVKLGSPKRSALTHEQIDKINVVRCDGFWGIKSSSSEKGKYELWLKYGEYTLRKYIGTYGKPDIIHAHNMIYAGLFALNTKTQFNIPVVITEHSSQYAMGEVAGELENLLQNAFGHHDNFYAVSPRLIDLLARKFSLPEGKIEWLPNVLDTNIEAVELPVQPKSGKFRFIHIANLIPLKGQKELIEAFMLAFKTNPDVELVIAGQGYLEKELKELIRAKNMSDQIHMIGLIDRQEVIRQLDLAHVLVLPSHYETFGVVLIEALSRGLPVVSTYCGGPECIVNNDNGILVEPKNTKQLMQALLRVHADYLKFDRVRLRRDTLNRFGGQAFYHSIIGIYQQIILSKKQ